MCVITFVCVMMISNKIIIIIIETIVSTYVVSEYNAEVSIGNSFVNDNVFV